MAKQIGPIIASSPGASENSVHSSIFARVITVTRSWTPFETAGELQIPPHKERSDYGVEIQKVSRIVAIKQS